ncbi:MAG: hypothetical protein LC803_10930 [Acidobacteria bacterium]|nr:hypothetical protein [Acidobacteriota bacterium]
MPTIEIVCVGQTEPSAFDGLPFAVEAEGRLVSHRALFQPDFDALQGSIYHLGNPAFRGRGGQEFFAFELVWEALPEHGGAGPLKFNDEYVPHVRMLFEQLLVASPVGRVTFSSDWQFGPDEARRFSAISSDRFWQMHDACELRFNALYEVVA